MLEARIAYAAYRHSAGGKSATGQPLPDWEMLSPAIQEAWHAAALALHVYAQECRLSASQDLY